MKETAEKRLKKCQDSSSKDSLRSINSPLVGSKKIQNCSKEEEKCTPKTKENSKSSPSPQNRLKETESKVPERLARKPGTTSTLSDKRAKCGANNSCNNNPVSRGVKYEFDDEDTDSEESPKSKSSPKSSDTEYNVDVVSNKSNNVQNAQLKNKTKQDTDIQTKAKMGRFDSDTDEERLEDIIIETKSPKLTKNDSVTQNTSKKKENLKKDVKQCEKRANFCDKNKVNNILPKNITSSDSSSDSSNIPSSQQVASAANKINSSDEPKCFTGNQINGFSSMHKLNDNINKNVKSSHQETVNKQKNQIPFQNKNSSQTTNRPLNNSIMSLQNNNVCNKFNNQTKCQNKITNNQKYLSNTLCQQMGKNNINSSVPQTYNKVDIQHTQMINCFNEQQLIGQQSKMNCETESSISKNVSREEEQKRVQEAQEALNSLSNNCISVAKSSEEKASEENLCNKKISECVNVSQNSWREVVNQSSISVHSNFKEEEKSFSSVKREMVNYQGNLNTILAENQSYFKNEVKEENGKFEYFTIYCDNILLN